MDGIKDYKCPCCNALLSFNASKQNLHCEFCGTEFELSSIVELDEAENEGETLSKYDWSEYEKRDYTPEESVNLAEYSCPSCGAEITGDNTLGATVCPYCGNATIVKKQFSGALKPDYIIPFRVDKKAAMAAFEAACAKAPFLPDEFMDKKRIEEMAGVYVPFWTFDCDCNADIKYDARRVSRWSDSRYYYTKTDFYRIMRAGKIGFANIPVDASKKAADEYMEALEPFDYSAAVEFNSAYLSGFLADKYDVSSDDCIARANERVQRSTEEAFRNTVNGYAAVIPKSSNVNFSDGKIRYSLLPVWMLNLKYNGVNYKYAINGQSGKTVGEYPICKKKRNIYFAKVFAISLAITIAAALAFMYLL